MACSISGCITSKIDKEVADKLTRIIISAQDRGRDSFGISSINNELKEVGSPETKEQVIRDFLESVKDHIIINNDRAEPTTEYVKEKTSDDIQPFTFENIMVTHNGTIANDKELIKQYNLDVKTNVDSAVLAPLIHKFLMEEGTMVDALKRLVKVIIGSYALAVVDKNTPNTLNLITNYKPLALWHDFDTIYFSSFPEYFHTSPFAEIEEISPYTIMQLNLQQEEFTFYKYSFAPTLNKTALVIASGGLDSTTVAYKLKEEGYKITLLHYNYQQQASTPELMAVQKLAKNLNCELIQMDSSIFNYMPSTLTNGSPISKTTSGIDGAQFAHEWVPARNLIFLSIAVGIAESRGISYVALGNNLEEAGAYPDNEMIFIKKLNNVLPFATAVNKSVQIIQPLGNLMKHEIVKLGLQLGVPYEDTWSCYEPGVQDDGVLHPCTQCGPCFMRQTAFMINKSKDPLLTQGFSLLK